MAITNASDLLVYAKTSGAVAQITRISVKTSSPFSTTGNLTINNVTNGSGVVSDGVATGPTSTNTGAACLGIITGKLEEGSNGYTISSTSISGDYTYADVTNGATGLVPTLEIINGSATLEDDAIIIEIRTPGSSDVFDPVAFSTQASFSSSVDLRDVTTKDSDGYSESIAGLKSFEISTELLQTVNPDHPLDGTDFFHELSERDEVNVSFSDRIRNLLTTNLVKSGTDNFTAAGSLSETYNQTDPFGGTTGTQLTTPASTASKYITYSLASGRVEGKKVTWSFYVKGIGSNSEASIYCNRPLLSVTKLSGSGSYTVENTQSGIISALSTDTNSNPANWTRMEATIDTSDMSSVSELKIYLYPGDKDDQDSDSIATSSWQIELKGAATDYQDPTTITHYQGNAFVTSVNYDAGVEDNLTCSATFTGTGINTLNT